jgi:hypothetical protein
VGFLPEHSLDLGVAEVLVAVVAAHKLVRRRVAETHRLQAQRKVMTEVKVARAMPLVQAAAVEVPVE